MHYDDFDKYVLDYPDAEPFREKITSLEKYLLVPSSESTKFPGNYLLAYLEDTNDLLTVVVSSGSKCMQRKYLGYEEAIDELETLIFIYPFLLKDLIEYDYVETSR